MANIRFGLVGYGAWGSHHARAIEKAEGAELTAIAARSEETRKAAQAAHPAVKAYSEYQDLIARKDIDVIDVVLPSHLHFEVGQAALEAGKHLLLEKPMAVSVEECRKLNHLAESKGRLLAVGFELRHSELWGKVKQMIDSGRLGELQYAIIELWRRPYRQGSQGWRYDINRVGNWVLEEPVHFFDLARWYFADLGSPRSVYACANSRQPGHPELQDNFSALVKFPTGAYALISQTLSGFQHHQVAKVTGTRGALWASWSGALDRDLHPSSSLKYFDGENIQDIPLHRPTGEVFELEDEIAGVVRCIRDGKPPAASGQDGIWSIALCEAAQQSLNQGQEISLADFRP